jgi:hypothetical protein
MANQPRHGHGSYHRESYERYHDHNAGAPTPCLADHHRL